MTVAIEQLAQDLLIDIKDRDLKEIIIATDSRLNSISIPDFEELKARLNELAPEVRVVLK